jgi:hypothetical protein
VQRQTPRFDASSAKPNGCDSTCSRSKEPTAPSCGHPVRRDFELVDSVQRFRAPQPIAAGWRGPRPPARMRPQPRSRARSGRSRPANDVRGSSAAMIASRDAASVKASSVLRRAALVREISRGAECAASSGSAGRDVRLRDFARIYRKARSRNHSTPRLPRSVMPSRALPAQRYSPSSSIKLSATTGRPGPGSTSSATPTGKSAKPAVTFATRATPPLAGTLISGLATCINPVWRSFGRLPRVTRKSVWQRCNHAYVDHHSRSVNR